jgi:hypothetical protein
MRGPLAPPQQTGRRRAPRGTPRPDARLGRVTERTREVDGGDVGDPRRGVRGDNDQRVPAQLRPPAALPLLAIGHAAMIPSQVVASGYFQASLVPSRAGAWQHPRDAVTPTVDRNDDDRHERPLPRCPPGTAAPLRWVCHQATATRATFRLIESSHRSTSSSTAEDLSPVDPVPSKLRNPGVDRRAASPVRVITRQPSPSTSAPDQHLSFNACISGAVMGNGSADGPSRHGRSRGHD